MHFPPASLSVYLRAYIGAPRLCRRATLIALIAFGLPALSTAQSIRVVTVPMNAADPALPHPAYNGHPVTLKAIARGFASLMDAQSAVFQWDTDADGTFDDEVSEAPRQCVSGTPEGTNCYDLGRRVVVPAQSTSRAINFQIRVSVPGGDPVVANYPVFVHADVPAQADPANHASAVPQNATQAQLAVMRQVAIDDALWYAHLGLLDRTGSGAAISAQAPTAAWFEISASTVRLFAETGHFPAYPPGEYKHDLLPGPYPTSVSAAFLETNDRRYETDPYAEDAVRLINHLLTNLVARSISPMDEWDEGLTPLPNTNDTRGLGVVSGWISPVGFAAAALSLSGLGGTVVQTATPYVRGWSIEQIVQQLVDSIAFAQNDIANVHFGGWSYMPNAQDFSLTAEGNARGVFGGLLAARDVMGSRGVLVPSRVASRLPSVLLHNQDPATGFARHFQDVCSGGNMAPTGDVIMAAGGLLGWNTFAVNDAAPYAVDFAGVPITRGQAREVFDRYVAAIGREWVTRQIDCDRWADGVFYDDGSGTPPYLRTDGRSNVEAILGIANGIRSLSNASDYRCLAATGPVAPVGGVCPVGSHDWQREFATFFIRNQSQDGHWEEVRWAMTVVGLDYYGPFGTTIAAASALVAPVLELVPDDRPPSISAPPDVAVGTNVACTYVGDIGTATASDDLTPALTISNDAPAAFSPGVHAITWRVADGSGKVATAVQHVTVLDDDPPSVAAPPGVQFEATGPAGTVIPASTLGTAEATDNCGEPAVEPAGFPSGGLFPIGQTPIVWTAVDGAGNSASDLSIVAVVDTTPPQLTLPPAVLLTPIDASGAVGTYAASAADLVSGPISPACVPVSGAIFPVGTTCVTCVASDAAGNTASGTFPVTVLRPGLVLAFGFSEPGNVTADASLAGNDGLLSGAAWTAAGKHGGAFVFDGVDDMITVADAESLDLAQMTVEAWVRPTAQSGWRSLVVKERGSDLAYALYAATDIDNRPATIGGPGAFIAANRLTHRAIGPALLALDEWTHVASTYDGTVLRLFVNGSEVAWFGVTGRIAVSGGALRIGGNAVWGEWFAGVIDEVRVYNRALGPDEILADMNITIP